MVGVLTNSKREQLAKSLEYVRQAVEEGKVDYAGASEILFALASRGPEAVYRKAFEWQLFPPFQMSMVSARNEERGWGFTEEDFATLRPVPDIPKTGLNALVLDVSLETPQETAKEAWYYIEKSYPKTSLEPGFVFDKEHIRLMPGIEYARGLRWRKVDLGASWGRIPKLYNWEFLKGLLNPAAAPHSAVLWAATYFTRWMKMMDGVHIPLVWVPGYQVTPDYRGAVPWSSMFFLVGDHINQEVSLRVMKPSELILEGCAFPNLLPSD